MRMMRHDVVATAVWRAGRTVKLSERSRATNSDASQVAYDAQRSVVLGFSKWVQSYHGGRVVAKGVRRHRCPFDRFVMSTQGLPVGSLWRCSTGAARFPRIGTRADKTQGRECSVDAATGRRRPRKRPCFYRANGR